ncbi:MAG: IS110 family transposase [Thermodesulfobacteriota bacterium]
MLSRLLYYAGVGLHKERSWFYITDVTGKRISSTSISNSPEELKKYFETITKPFVLAVEATYNWYFFVDIAEEYAEKVYLANSYELKAFAKRHKKTDKIDARLIADVLRKGYLLTVTIPDKNTRGIKEFLRYRMNIVVDRTRNISRLKNILDKLGENSSGNFTTYKRLNEISAVHFPFNYQEAITGYVERIRYLSKELHNIEKFLREKAFKDSDIINLMFIPGLNYFSTVIIKSEIIDICRFASFNRLCAYAGFAPRVSQSANKTFHGPLNKNRRKTLQWILIEVVPHFIRALPDKQRKYLAIRKRKGVNTAKVVLARDMLKIIYHVLKEKRPFYINKQTDYKVRSAVAPALCGV